MRKKLIAGNWKMYKTTAEAVAFAKEFKLLIAESASENETAICAPFTQLAALKAELQGSGIGLGAQNMHFEEDGAYTGEISAAMLTEIGVDYCVIGHSERRQYFAETDETVNKKLHAAIAHDITPIFCVGEALEQRDAGEEFNVVRSQIAGGLAGLAAFHVGALVIAYEPVWAIGTGRTATAEQAEEMCRFIRSEVKALYDDETADNVRIQYGGSVKPENAAEILNMPDIDGALVGGASLLPDKFFEICKG
jgi:triosephosphate isomerase